MTSSENSLTIQELNPSPVTFGALERLSTELMNLNWGRTLICILIIYVLEVHQCSSPSDSIARLVERPTSLPTTFWWSIDFFN